MVTICMGRFVMDLPQGMTMDGYVTLYYGLDKNFKTVDVTIESLNATPDSMRTQLDTRATEIAQRDRNWETKKSMLLENRRIDDHMIYLRKQGAMESAVGLKHELHLLIGKTQVRLDADSYEGLPDDPGDPTESTEKVEARLFKLATQIHAYDDPEKAGPGFCLGPVVIDSDHDEESASISMTMDRYPDLSMDVDSKGLTPEGSYPRVFQRMTEMDRRSDTHVLRKDTTTLGGMQAQEWLARATDEHDKKRLAFIIESSRPDPALARPLMTIKLNAGRQLANGEYVDASLTPKEGMALWDAITRSIRARPDAVKPKPPLADSPR
jgi:hypothetical protein